MPVLKIVNIPIQMMRETSLNSTSAKKQFFLSFLDDVREYLAYRELQAMKEYLLE
jgi:hypothetical protein